MEACCRRRITFWFWASVALSSCHSRWLKQMRLFCICITEAKFFLFPRKTEAFKNAFSHLCKWRSLELSQRCVARFHASEWKNFRKEVCKISVLWLMLIVGNWMFIDADFPIKLHLQMWTQFWQSGPSLSFASKHGVLCALACIFRRTWVTRESVACSKIQDANCSSRMPASTSFGHSHT